MKRAVVVAGLASALGILVFWLWPAAPEPVADAAAPVAPRVGRGPLPMIPVEPPRAGGGRLSGQVLDEEGTPVEGVAVEVVLDAPLDLTGCPGLLGGCSCGDATGPVLQRAMQRLAPVAITTSGWDGGFAIDGLPDVPLTVRAQQDRSWAAESARPGAEAVALQLETGAFGPLVVRDEAGRTVDDAVVLAMEAGKVLFVDRLGPAPRILPVPREAVVRAFAAGFQSAVYDGEDEDEDPDLFVLTVHPGIVVTGTLLGPDGVPLANAEMTARESDARALGPACVQATSGADGRFTLGPLSGRTWRVNARAGSVAAGLTIADGGIEQSQGHARVRGTVRDAAKQPIAGAEVSVLRWRGSRPETTSAATDPDGRFDLATAPGRVEVHATADGMTPAAQEHDGLLGEGETWNVALTLTAKPRIRGRVEDPSGQPLAEVEVEAMARGEGIVPGQRHTDTVTADDGTFSLDVAGPDVHLTFDPPDNHVHHERDVKAPLDGLVVVLAVGGTIQGRVVDARSRPVVDAHVWNGADAQAMTEEDGTFTLEGLPDGVTRIEARADDEEVTPSVRRRAVAKVDVRNGHAPFIELRLEPITGMHGRVEDQTGAPVAGATVTAEDVRGRGFSITYRTACDEVAAALKAPGAAVPVLARTVSADDGSFELKGVKGPVRLHGETPALEDDTESMQAFGVVMGDEAVVRLRPRRYLTAQLSTADGKPVTQVLVCDVPVAVPGGALSLPLGTRHVAGPLVLRVPGYRPEFRNVTMLEAQAGLGAIVFQPAREVKVSATDARSGAGVAVALWKGPVKIAEQRSAGEVVALGPNDTALDVYAPGFAPRIAAEFPASEATVAVLLEPEAVITGHVRKSDGTPMGRRMIDLAVIEAAGCPKPTSTLSMANGDFALHGLSGGTCTVRARSVTSRDGGYGPSQVVALPPRGTVRVDLALP